MSSKPKGFAAMDPARQREISSGGGVAAHATGRAHKFTTEEARAAARKRHQKRLDVAAAHSLGDALGELGGGGVS